MNNCSPRERIAMAIELREGSGLSFGEIGRRLGRSDNSSRPVSAVRVRQLYAAGIRARCQRMFCSLKEEGYSDSDAWDMTQFRVNGLKPFTVHITTADGVEHIEVKNHYYKNQRMADSDCRSRERRALIRLNTIEAKALPREARE